MMSLMGKKKHIETKGDDYEMCYVLLHFERKKNISSLGLKNATKMVLCEMKLGPNEMT